MKEYYKLVRDKIPAIIREKGKECSCRVAIPGSEGYRTALRMKLLEEAQEFVEDPCVEELADLLEVVEAIKLAEKISDEEITDARQKKNAARGAFAKGIILEKVF